MALSCALGQVLVEQGVRAETHDDEQVGHGLVSEIDAVEHDQRLRTTQVQGPGPTRQTTCHEGYPAARARGGRLEVVAGREPPRPGEVALDEVVGDSDTSPFEVPVVGQPCPADAHLPKQFIHGARWLAVGADQRSRSGAEHRRCPNHDARVSQVRTVVPGAS